MKNIILLSFDVEEFDIPLDYGRQISTTEQMAVGMSGLHAISPLLSDKNITTTLFTTAHFAEYFPEQIKELSQKHEIASHTFYHSKFEIKDLIDSKTKLEELTGKTISGLRMPKMMPVSVEAVSNAGYSYDASIHPTWLPGRYNNWHLPKTAYFENELLRIPASVSPTLRIPLFWLSFKNLPFEYYKMLAIKTLRNDGVLSLYFHPWEFVDLNGYRLPQYTKNICGDELIERLQKLLNILKEEGEFLSMHSYASSIIKKSSGSIRRINIPSFIE